MHTYIHTYIHTHTYTYYIGYQIANALKGTQIPVTYILDCAVGRVIEKVDLVLVGAEAVTENGGIINKIGIYIYVCVCVVLC